MQTDLKCLIAAENAKQILACLKPLLCEANLPLPTFLIAETREQVAEQIANTQLLLAQPAWVAPHLSLAKNLTWMQSTFAGIEPLVVKGCRTDYVLTGVKDIFGPLMSEYVFSAVLAHTRHAPYYRHCQSQGLWQPKPYKALAGQHMAVIGLGSIGRHLVRTAQHFGLQVLGVNRTGQAVDGLDDVIALSELGGRLNEMDFIVLALPATPASCNLVNTEFLRELKSTALLINVGRGALVDEEALVCALSEARLAAAVLDVFKQEPLPIQHPFWKLPNLHITPHNAAVTFPQDIARIFCENYGCYLDGKPLQYVVDFDRGY